VLKNRFTPSLSDLLPECRRLLWLFRLWFRCLCDTENTRHLHSKSLTPLLLQRNNESDAHKVTSAIIFWCHYLGKVMVPEILKILSGQTPCRPPIPTTQIITEKRRRGTLELDHKNKVKCGGFWRERERERERESNFFCRRMVGINVNTVTDGQTDVMQRYMCV
jgi:hypothetical protein